MQERFKVLTLNCWGVFFPYVTVRKDDRLNSIAKRLCQNEFDVVLLQEVINIWCPFKFFKIWLISDYRKLKKLLNETYPFSNHFRCGFIGTGMCVFCKWPIDSVFLHPYEANGYPHLVHQGDWYCGKGVGLIRVTSKEGFKINLYTTHLIARYSLRRSLDKFSSHRISQLIELMEFVKLTSSGSDAIIITGDFNLESDTTAIELFQTSLKLSDAWLDNAISKNNPNLSQLETEGCTCDRADNPYRNDAWTKAYGNGERLDYIFYRSGPSVTDSSFIPTKVKLECDSCWLDFREVPGDPNGLHYSDHEGVAANFTISRLPNSNTEANNLKPIKTDRLKELYADMDEQLRQGLDKCYFGRLIHLTSAGLIAIILWLLILTRPTEYWLLSTLKCFTTTVLGAVLFVLLWGSCIGRISERKAIQNARQIISFIFTRLHDENIDFLKPMNS